LYLYPFDTVHFSELRKVIVEWLSPDFHRSMYLPFLLVVLLFMAALAWSRVPVRGRVLVPSAFLFLSALDAVRHIPIFILVAMPVIAQALSRSVPAALSAARPPRQQFRPLLNGAVLLLLAAFALWRWTNLAHHQNQREAELFPSRAVTFLRAGSLPTRLYAYYDWGGYAIWNLYPEYRTFADGRSDLYGDVLLKQAAETLPRVRAGWQAVLDGWNVETILIPPTAALAQALVLDPGWNSPYHDSQAVIFVRRRPSQPTLPSALSSKRPYSEKMFTRGRPNLRN
ncbi:MAG: hypothetical protein WCC04_11315, partial [Terriglobales bacterium]